MKRGALILAVLFVAALTKNSHAASLKPLCPTGSACMAKKAVPRCQSGFQNIEVPGKNLVDGYACIKKCQPVPQGPAENCKWACPGYSGCHSAYGIISCHGAL